MGVSATASYADPRRERQAQEQAAMAESPQIGPDIIANNLDDTNAYNALNIHNVGKIGGANVAGPANDSEISPTSSGQTGSNEIRIVIQPARLSRSPNVAGSSSSRALQRQWPMPPGHLGPAVSMFMEDTGTATNTRANTVAETDESNGDNHEPAAYDPTAWSTASEFGGSVTPETQQQYLQYQRYVRQEEERERLQSAQGLQSMQSLQSFHPGGLQPPPSLPLPQPPQLPPSGLSTRRASGVPSSAVLGAGQQWGSAYGFYGDDGNNNNGGGGASSRDRSQRSARSNRSTDIMPSRPSDDRQDSSGGSDNTQTGTSSRRNRFNFGSIGYGRAL
ncbi:hypothetical protein Sste5346_009837 [Sporothrix stenoceras]|uniref:Uncharacterized protein n=1 Tax=Sporothrix stenoceras TaxID=5173 RepID=A0ABR3YI87_9PEZI